MAQKYEIPPEFLDAADRFVALANDIAEDKSRDWVRAALMYAAARYNAFTWITREDNPQQTLEQAVVYFRNEYETMLRENVKEIGPHYAQASSGNAQAQATRKKVQ
jgi:hypothetical protein